MSFSFGSQPTTTSSGSTSGGFMLPPTNAAAPTAIAPNFGGASTGVFSFGNVTPAAGPGTSTLPTFGGAFAAPIATTASLFGGSGSFSFSAPTSSTTSTGPVFAAKPTLNFSTPATSAPGMSLLGAGAPKSVQFGGVQTSAPGLGFPASTAVTTSTFSLGAAPGGGFALSNPSSTGPGLALGTPSMATPATNFSLGAPATSAPSNVSLAAAAPLVPSSGFSLGAPAATGFTLAAALAAPVASSVSFSATSLPQTTTPSAGFSLASAPSTTSAFGTGLLAKPATSAPLGGMNFGNTTLSTPSLAVGSTTATAVPTLGALTTTSAGAQPQVSLKTMTYSELEEHINKWTLELEEQEKVFLNQATQVNAWDRMLLDNGDTITALNSTMESLKLEQSKLEMELDYIMSQERELEESIVPLEKAVTGLTCTDTERAHTYELAANLEGQTKQMAEQLKETIDHLNELNRAQDGSNPVIQISRILNAHMNSLQWIEQTTSATQLQLEDVTKSIEVMKKDLEHPYNLSGYHV